MKHGTVFAELALLGVLSTGGCATGVVQTEVDQPVPDRVEVALSSGQATFGVGDELGWIAFGDLALAPAPGQMRDVLVIVRAEPVDADGFDWIGRYLALAD